MGKTMDRGRSKSIAGYQTQHLRKISRGIRQPLKAGRRVWYLGRRWFADHVKSMNIFNREWDLLIVLDACRTDLVEEVIDEYGVLTEMNTIYSVASSSKEWMEATFDNRWRSETSNTVYVTGNPFSDQILDASDFEILDEVWRYGWDEVAGTISPRPITDRAIMHSRMIEYDRMIVHYMQPHFPCVPEPEISSGVRKDDWGRVAMSVWDDFKAGQLSVDDVWSASLSNLRYVLDDVSILVNNVDAETVVITADHGNAFGEGGEYGHNASSLLDEVRRVPWIETTANDYGEYQPAEYETAAIPSSAEEQLHALGYK